MDAVTGAAIGPNREIPVPMDINANESTVPREEVKGHGAIQVREVWENVFHSWELLWGAHEGGRQVIG